MPPTLAWLVLTLAGLLFHAAAAAAQPGVIWLVRDAGAGPMPGSRTATPRPGQPAAGFVAAEAADRADTPIAPGSILKIATIAAALESGAISATTGVSCARTIVAAGHTLRCTHADVHRPLRAADALSQSCNVFAVSIAERLSRSALDRVLIDLGLPATDPAVPLTAAAVGVDGLRATPRQLLTMVERIAADPSPLPWKPATLAVIRDGLAQAARSGTAAAFNEHGLRVIAKTGTTVSGGRALGVVAGVAQPPAGTPGGPRSFVLVASGGAGVDAAALAADRLSALARGAGAVTIGIPNASGRPGRDGYDLRTLSLEDYVAGVVAGEAAPAASPAALEALAITVRTYALANRARHREDGFDLCSLTHCQVLRPATPASSAAARATAGQVLLDRGRLASVYFSAACGGRRARPSEVWPGAADPPYLPADRDEACASEPGWRTEIAAADLLRALRASGVRGDTLRNLRVVARSASGRVQRVALDGVVPPDLSGEELRSMVGRTLGWARIESTNFAVERTAAGFRFTGTGRGHGVGLCVIGSVRRAAQGQNAPAILAAYFPGLTIGPAPAAAPPAAAPPAAAPPAAASPAAASRVAAPRLVTGGADPAARIVVIVPQEEQPAAEELRRSATRMRDELVTALAMAPPARITLRFHPTVESYQRATGRQWFTAGATTPDGQAHFLPLTTLRQRGLVQETMRHELVHVLTAAAYRGRPVWVHEGAAEFYAATHQAPGSELTGRNRRGVGGSTSLASCPSDAELLRPSSREALRDAYRRALRCFAAALATGRGWREVGGR